MVFKSNGATTVHTISFPSRLGDWKAGLHERFDGANGYLIGPENRMVQTVVDAATEFARCGLQQDEAPPAWLNPLVISGPPGCGKSFLVDGLVSILLDAAGSDHVLTTSASDFAAQYQAATADDSLDGMRIRIRSARVWIIEDLGRLTVRKSVQPELLARLDEKLEAGGWVVATAGCVPSQLSNLVSAIRTRLEAGFTLPLASPGLDVRREFLRREAAVQGLAMQPQEVDEIARRTPATFRELLGVVHRTKLNRQATADTQPMDDCNGSTAAAAVAAKVRPEDVLAVTARYFSVPQAALKSASRKQSLVHARSVAMYLTRELADSTLQEIGQLLGGRDHSTVLHACRKIDQSATRQVSLQEELADLRRLLLAT